MRRLNLFAKGNVDVRDSLLYSRVSGTIGWNGINEIVREQFPGNLVRVRHEVWSRSDALLEARGTVPPDLVERHLVLGPFSTESQFSRQIFTSPTDAVVLSIQPDLMNALFRHRSAGYLFYPYGWHWWSVRDKHWLRENFTESPALEVGASMDFLAAVCTEIRKRLDGPILVYNLSAAIPGELIDCYLGMEEVLSTRIRRFNLGLIDLSRRLGVSVVDVDAIVARGGADRLKIDPLHLTAEGYRLVAQEVVRILHESGCFDTST